MNVQSNLNDVVTILDTMININNSGIIKTENEQSSNEENHQSDENLRKRKPELLNSPDTMKRSKNM